MSRLTHAQAAKRLRAAGITWSSSGNSSDRNNRKSTSFEQIKSRTIDGIIRLRRASGCAIHITGGTEVGHSLGTYSHWKGYKLDIKPNEGVSKYIEKNFSYIGVRGDGAKMYRSHAGNIYARESTHWDITYH